MTQQPVTIVAVVDDDATSDPVIQRATELGLDRSARVILYDVGATAGLFASPLPTEVASDGPDRGVPALLTAQDLDSAGQSTLASRVRAMSEAGIDAYGWLPERDDAEDLAEYARGVGATSVLTRADRDPSPESLTEAGLHVEAIASR